MIKWIKVVDSQTDPIPRNVNVLVSGEYNDKIVRDIAYFSDPGEYFLKSWRHAGTDSRGVQLGYWPGHYALIEYENEES